MTASPIAMRRNVDGSVVLLGKWPEKIIISTELLESKDHLDLGVIKVEGDNVEFKASNGAAGYLITERGLLHVNAKLVWCKLEGEPVE